VNESDNEKIRRMVPTKEFSCSQCGLNHEARDFMRAMLLHLIDELEQDSLPITNKVGRK
jgi:hypothetical protein